MRRGNHGWKHAWVGAWGWLSGVGMTGLGMVGCAPPQPVNLQPTTQEWRAAVAELGRLGEALQIAQPTTLNVSLELTQVQLGKRMSARGAVAVMPQQGLRMMLLGPGGTTAMDLWICHDRYDLRVPAIDLVRRGDRHTPPEQRRGLPVAFLRWWFLRPVAGQLLNVVRGDAPAWAGPTPPPISPGARHRFAVRDGVHTNTYYLGRGQEVGFAGTDVLISRRSTAGTEWLWSDGGRCGDVHYLQPKFGIDIIVRCEGVAAGVPPSRAFDDPTSGAPCTAATASENRGRP